MKFCKSQCSVIPLPISCSRKKTLHVLLPIRIDKFINKPDSFISKFHLCIYVSNVSKFTTYHLVALRKKLSSRVTLLRRLVGSGLGAGAKTLRIATLSLVHSTAEYCAPVWCRSEHCASLTVS